MKTTVLLAGLVLWGIVTAGCSASAPREETPQMAKAKASYALKGDQVEGCECASVCPCVFAHDVTFNDCRGTAVWHIREGHYGSIGLNGITFAVVLTKAGKNMQKSTGKWEGVIYISNNANADQKNAIGDILNSNWGKIFSRVEVRTEPIEFVQDGEKHEVRIGTLASLRSVPLPGAGGKAPTIDHATFSLIPVLHCATTTENTYDDGAGTQWDFKGRNSFFGPFDYRAE